MLDCRWLGRGGVGRVTEHLLTGLSRGGTRVRWTLWGPEQAGTLAPGLPLVRYDGDPRSWAGQRAALQVPYRAGVVLFMHQTRPLVGRRSVTLIHDTTQLRTSPSPVVAHVRRRFLRRSARAGAGVITVSPWSRDRIVEDLGLARERILVVPNPADPEFGRRIGRLRVSRPRGESVLYVGSFARHKNVDGLIAAFHRSATFREGGSLVLVGGAPDARIAAIADRPGSRVNLVGPCPQEQLDELFAEARILVQPSFEEGFGLPVWEAMSAGLPVACSRGGALSSVGAGATTTFDPASIDDMARAIDDAVEVARSRDHDGEAAAADAFLASAPTPEDYARAMEDAALDLAGGAQ